MKAIVFSSALLIFACNPDKTGDTGNIEDSDTSTSDLADTSETDSGGDDTGEPEDTNVEIEAQKGSDRRTRTSRMHPRRREQDQKQPYQGSSSSQQDQVQASWLLIRTRAKSIVLASVTPQICEFRCVRKVSYHRD